MKRLIDTITNIWKIEELRKRILYTLGLLLIYRIGSFIVLPGVNPDAITKAAGGGGSLLDLINVFAGGAFNRASVFALGIMPYISASIAVQLLGMALPSFQKMQKEGESGRRKINQITRILTIAVTVAQGFGFIQFVKSTYPDAIMVPMGLFTVSTMVILATGTMFVMWMGERITDRGIGNGISLLITVGIIASLPGAVASEFTAKMAGNGGLVWFVIELAALVVMTILVIALVQATRKIPVQYAKRIVGQGARRMQAGGQRQYLPLKMNQAGVMPIIFAQALMFLPPTLGQIVGGENSAFLRTFSDFTSVGYNVVYFLLVVVFTYFYTALSVNPVQIADDLKRNGGFIPGVKPGKKTSEFIDNVISRITLPGSLFLAFVSITPAFAYKFMGAEQGFSLFFGGTSLIIMVGVVLDTLQQIESHLLSRHYDGLMKSGGKIKGRSGGMVSTSGM